MGITKEEFAKLIDTTGYIALLTDDNHNNIVSIDYQESLDAAYEEACRYPNKVFYVIPGARFEFNPKGQ